MSITLTFSAPGLPSITSGAITIFTPTPTPPTDYTTLQAQIADWLNRSGVTMPVSDFITLAEAEMKRRIRRSSTRATITISAAETTLPADVAEVRSLHLTTGIAAIDKPMRNNTYAMLASRSAANAGLTGRPTDFALMGQTLLVSPAPDQSYTASIYYFRQLTPLAVDATTNAILTEAPDAYLYGALLQAAPYMEDDTRILAWQTKFRNAIAQLNQVAADEDYGAPNRPARLPMSF